jgi:StAR-related lipid transfer protein 10
MLDGYEICTISPNSDLGYYSGRLTYERNTTITMTTTRLISVRSPPPFKNRDFVTQRCWIDFGRNREKYVMNHSVNYIVSVMLV